MPQASALPAAQQARRDKLLGRNASDIPNTDPTATQGTAPANEPTPAPSAVTTGDTPPATTPPATTPPANNAEVVQLTREELNALQARADSGESAARNAARLAQELEELQHHLTALQSPAKGNGAAPVAAPATPAPAAFAVDVGETTVTPEEEAEYGDSKPYILKLVRAEVKAVLDKLLPGIQAKFEEVGGAVEKAVGGVRTVREQSFITRVKAAIADFDTIVGHTNWKDFLQARRPGTTLTNSDAIGAAHSSQSLEVIQEIFADFRNKYIGAGGKGAYAGAVGSGGATPSTGQTEVTGKLPISERNKASEDFKKGRISWEELQVVKKKFDAAEAAGNVDYNK